VNRWRRPLSQVALAASRLLIITGAWFDEILRMRWDEVDPESGVMRLKDSMTGAKVIFLNKPAVEVLEALPRMLDNPYVIAGDKEGTNLVNPEKPWDAIREKAKIQGVDIHDLRHTFASYAIQGGMNLEMLGALLGHNQTSTTRRYAHLDSRQHRENSEITGKAINSILKR